jgi:two-component system, chemotaxis family, chemotaxis protein CheY
MKKVLVVDDSRAMRMILSRTLMECGFEVEQAASGTAALDCLAGQAGGFQLAMVDWNMPEMSGLEFIQAVRARPEFQVMRLLMVTTETEIEQMSRALEAGADEYLMKPFTADAVKDKLKLLGVCA